MADPPDEKKEDEADAPPKLSPDMEAARRILAEHEARAAAGMPQPVDDPMERRARWMRVTVLVSALLLGVGLLWSRTRSSPVPQNVVAHARTAAAARWAALSRCLVGEPLAPGELASSRMRRIYLALPRAAQRISPDDHDVWPRRCAVAAHDLTEALRPARTADAHLGELASSSIGVYVALSSGHIPSSVDSLFAVAGAAHLQDVDAPHGADAPPPLALLDATDLDAYALDGPDARVVDLDDHRVLLRGERDVLCLLDDADARFSCRPVPGEGGALSGLALVPGNGARSLAFYRDATGTASKVVDLATGTSVTEGALEAVEMRGDDVLAVRGRPPGTPEVLAGTSTHAPTLSLAVPRGELRLWAPVLAAPTPDQAGLVAWTTVARGGTVLRVASTGDGDAFGPTAARQVSLGVDPPVDVTACAEHGTRAVLVQLGELPPPATLPLPDGGVRLADAAVPLALPDASVPAIRPHGTGAHPYQPLPSDLPEEHTAAIVVVGADGSPTVLRATISGEAVLSCDSDAAVLTTLRSAADRTGAHDEGPRSWRLGEPSFLVTQLRCTTAGCLASSATLRGFRDEPEVRAAGGRVVVLFRAAASGGVRARVAPIDELEDAEDVVLADDQLHDGVEVREERVGTGPRGALLVARTSAGVLAWRVGADGEVRLLAGRR